MDGLQVHEKVLNISNHRENANQATIKYHSHLLEWLLSKRQEITSVGENIFAKRSYRQRINLQNIQTAHGAQCQKNKQPN